MNVKCAWSALERAKRFCLCFRWRMLPFLKRAGSVFRLAVSAQYIAGELHLTVNQVM